VKRQTKIPFLFLILALLIPSLFAAETKDHSENSSPVPWSTHYSFQRQGPVYLEQWMGIYLQDQKVGYVSTVLEPTVLEPTMLESTVLEHSAEKQSGSSGRSILSATFTLNRSASSRRKVSGPPNFSRSATVLAASSSDSIRAVASPPKKNIFQFQAP